MSAPTVHSMFLQFTLYTSPKQFQITIIIKSAVIRIISSNKVIIMDHTQFVDQRTHWKELEEEIH